MVKSTIVNFEGEEKELFFQKLKTSAVYYVNKVTGSDDNDGLSRSTAFKSLAKINALLSNKGSLMVNHVHVYLADGLYQESILLNNISNTKIVLHGESTANTIIEGDGVNQPIIVRDILYVETRDLTIRPKATSEIWAMAGIVASDIGDLQISETTFIDLSQGDHTGKEIKGIGVFKFKIANAEINCKINGCEYILHCTQAKVRFGGSSDNIEGERRIYVSESIVTSYPSDGKEIKLLQSLGSSLEVQKINNGIIVESGTNENGSYIKFADGTLIMHGLIVVDPNGFTAFGDIYYKTSSVNLPATPKPSEHKVFISVKRASSVSWGTIHPSYNNITQSIYILTIGDPLKSGNPAANFIVTFEYIGRWK